MSINVIQLIQSALSDSVVRQLSERFGLPPAVTDKVIGAAAPALVAALMHKGATLEGARSLFTTIMAPEVNAHIGEQLPQLLASTAGLSLLEGAGRQLLARVTDRRLDGVSDTVAAQTGVPAQSAHALTGIVGATLLGVLKRHFLEAQGSVGQLPTLLGHQLPAIAPFLNDGLLSALGLGGVATFMGSVLPQLKAVSAHIEHPVAPAAPVNPSVHTTQAPQAAPRVPVDAVLREERRSHSWLWWLLAALAAVLAFLFLRGCQHEQTLDVTGSTSQAASVVAAASAPAVALASDVAASTVAASDVVASAPAASAPAASAELAASASAASQPAAAPAPTKDSQLTFTVDPAGKPTLTATVGSEAEKAALIDALTKKFGADHVAANITVDPDTKPADWLSHLDALLPLMALPGAEVKLDGARIELSGTAANAKLGWLERLKSLFGASYQIGAFNAEQAVADATQSFRSAIKDLLAPDSSCVVADVVKVLNLQVINFTSASARVPASAVDDLRQSAQVLMACSQNGKAAKLEVAGYSDNVGGDQQNLLLSKKRAESVRAFLVRTGVPADSLTAQGYGDAHPVASNDTESGRFANRRIEFVEAQQ
ncbi:OmpA family protein [Paraburkholderia phenazinium]|uniref:Outer membrane protein OmpA n=1 Tax=Paraburkholderia phenazinium TaxID=60549 RepID=A0A1N6EDI3_9BURK|nr:OmpA family protein [Paraburkholderia phenazinium]SIN81112.1 Outer membrane protein OmpA [Paraburkholderia phenazinium]